MKKSKKKMIKICIFKIMEIMLLFNRLAVWVWLLGNVYILHCDLNYKLSGSKSNQWIKNFFEIIAGKTQTYKRIKLSQEKLESSEFKI